MSCLASEVWLERQHDEFIEEYGDLISALEIEHNYHTDILCERSRKESKKLVDNVMSIAEKLPLFRKRLGRNSFYLVCHFYRAYMNYQNLDKIYCGTSTHREVTPDFIVEALEFYFEPRE